MSRRNQQPAETQEEAERRLRTAAMDNAERVLRAMPERDRDEVIARFKKGKRK